MLFGNAIACQKAQIGLRKGGSKGFNGDSVKGTYVADPTLALAECSKSRSAEIHQVVDSGDISPEVLATASIDEKNKYEFTNLSKVLDSSGIYTVVVNDCDHFYSRVVTSSVGQNISAGTSLVVFAVSASVHKSGSLTKL